MSENLKQGLLTFAAAVLFCIAVALLISRIDVIRTLLEVLEYDRTEAVREVDYENGDY